MIDLFAELKAVLHALDTAGVPYALCGGLALLASQAQSDRTISSPITLRAVHWAPPREDLSGRRGDQEIGGGKETAGWCWSFLPLPLSPTPPIMSTRWSPERRMC